MPIWFREAGGPFEAAAWAKRCWKNSTARFADSFVSECPDG
jgi:hypothetical protein